MSLLEDLEGIIIGLDCATQDGVDIFRDTLPDEPDDAIVLYEYYGEPFNHVEGIFRSVQIKVRRKTYADARTISWQIYEELHTPTDKIRALGGRPALISVRNTPLKTESDGTGRTSFSFNINITTTND